MLDGSPFPNLLSAFVYTRTYARWMEELARRETWPETVERYVDFVFRGRDVPGGLREQAERLILSLDVLPSMRALWCAGPAMERDNVCGYNCASLPVDNLRAFSEALYILMQGTGVGFSVERTFINNLPVIAHQTGEEIDYIVGDSTEGWADAVYFGMVQFHLGRKVNFNYSHVREKGARLKTKGGRASGPEPLKRVLDFAQATCAAAAGRHLKPLEAHDIMCMIAEIVMVGGFRRASLISFSDVDDEEMRHAKDWNRGQFPSIRYMANNSAVYPERPTEEVFWREWDALAASGSGERGFFCVTPPNIIKRGREFRCNPCISARSWVNTTEGPRQVSDLIGKPFEAVVDGKVYKSSRSGFWRTGVKPLFRLETSEGYSLELTGNHQVCRVRQTARNQHIEWVQASDLVPGDLVRVNNHRDVEVSPNPRSDLGWLLGSLIGDGTLAQADGNRSDSGLLRFWGADAEFMAGSAMAKIKSAGIKVRSDAGPVNCQRYWQVSSTSLGAMAHSYGLIPAYKTITPRMEQESEDFAAGLLSGLFDADGTVSGNLEKGLSVRLSQSNLSTLQAAQRMLLRLGVVSSIYPNRREAGSRPLPDGHGGSKDYTCQASHELVVANDNLFRFMEVVGFTDPSKKALLDDLLGGYRRAPNRERFVATFTGLTPLGEEEVFDCTIPDLGAFDANGLYVHNCAEIKLGFKRALNPWTGEGGGGQFCNLTAAVMRAHDTQETMAEKVRVATWLGAIQASYTYFPYLRPAWKELCEEDNLLGVDITGQCDNPALSENEEVMTYLNKVAINTAIAATSILGTNVPAAITCGKPSGNSSQFVDCASGFHPRYAPFYFRHVRISAKDPLFHLIRDQGVPLFPENGQEHLPSDQVDVWVARFPVRAPEGAKIRHHERALDQCKRYLQVMRTWCGEKGHNQSATIYVRDEEWKEVGLWLWENFDDVTGLSFLNFDESGTKYRLPPYVEITEAQYLEAQATMPVVDFTVLSYYETRDEGEGAAVLACSGGSCEL